MVDWERYRRLLVSATEATATKFLSESPNYDLVAFGYTFELANNCPAFSLAANSREFLAKTQAAYRIHTPSVTAEDLRWTSGDFEYGSLWMSQLIQPVEWEDEYVFLHELSCKGSDSFALVYDGLVEISCEALATVASRGLLGDWRRSDFQIAEYCDDREVVRARHQRVIEIIESGQMRRSS